MENTGLIEYIRKIKEHKLPESEYIPQIDSFLLNHSAAANFPYSGTFELTPLCNFDCKMCYVHLGMSDDVKRRMLSTEQWKDIMSQAIDAGLCSATLTGGEVLTRDDFEEIYLYLYDCGIVPSILTNGSLLNDNRIEFLKKYPPKKMQITLYGCSDDIYESVTGRRVFGTVLENIKKIIAAELNLQLAITPNKYMNGTAEETYRLAYSLCRNTIFNAALKTPRSETGRTIDGADISIDEYIRLHHIKAELTGATVFPKCESEDDLPDIPEFNSNTISRGLRCNAARNSFQVSWDGTMYPCSSLRECGASPLENGFDASWKKINEYVLNYPAPVECVGCKYEKACLHCVAVHRDGAPLGHADPRICLLGRKMVSEGLVKLD